MPTKLYDAEGAEVEAYLPADVDTKVKEAVTAKEAEFTPKIKTLEEELGTAKKNLGERANQFATFRKLNDDVVAKLSEAERTIYENGLALSKVNEERAEADKKNKEAMVESVIRSKAGTDEKLVAKMKGMWEIFGVEANTPEQMEQKSRMILGAIGQSEPDLLASVAGFSNGSFAPPEQPGAKKEEDKTFADTPKGKAIANELGLKLEPDKKK
jgi:hypothetical protein